MSCKYVTDVLIGFCVLISGPDLDDDEDAENQADSHINGDTKQKSLQQKTGEALLRHILNSDCVEGSSYSFRYVAQKHWIPVTFSISSKKRQLKLHLFLCRCNKNRN